jgi:hypothetical protein
MYYLFAQFYHSGFSSGPPALFMFLFVTVFVIVIGTIIFRAIRGLSQWSENNEEPVLVQEATVVTKRTAVSSNGRMDNSDYTSTTYYATFEFSTGSRREFEISGNTYGGIAECDTGQLTFQGTRYKGFERTGTMNQPAQKAAPAANTTGQNTSDEIRFCPFCGTSISNDFKYCAKCGKPLPEYVSES